MEWQTDLENAPMGERVLIKTDEGFVTIGTRATAFSPGYYNGDYYIESNGDDYHFAVAWMRLPV